MDDGYFYYCGLNYPDGVRTGRAAQLLYRYDPVTEENTLKYYDTCPSYGVVGADDKWLFVMCVTKEDNNVLYCDWERRKVQQENFIASL